MFYYSQREKKRTRTKIALRVFFFREIFFKNYIFAFINRVLDKNQNIK
jgi:hypothetical protein